LLRIGGVRYTIHSRVDAREIAEAFASDEQAQPAGARYRSGVIEAD